VNRSALTAVRGGVAILSSSGAAMRLCATPSRAIDSGAPLAFHGSGWWSMHVPAPQDKPPEVDQGVDALVDARPAGPIRKSAASVATIALAGVLVLPACGPTFQQMAAADCAGIATDTAYEDCRRRLAEQLADERLGYIVRSQVVR
jgi:hypothetical protein